MNNVLLNIIMLCHIIVICFVVLVPFLGNSYFLLMHAILVPFIILHWILNDDTCVLSTLETKIREKMNGGIKVDRNECFTCQLIDPIYKFNFDNNTYSTLIYVITIALWLVSVGKLYSGYKSGTITSFYNLMMSCNK